MNGSARGAPKERQSHLPDLSLGALLASPNQAPSIPPPQATPPRCACPPQCKRRGGQPRQGIPSTAHTGTALRGFSSSSLPPSHHAGRRRRRAKPLVPLRSQTVYRVHRRFSTHTHLNLGERVDFSRWGRRRGCSLDADGLRWQRGGEEVGRGELEQEGGEQRRGVEIAANIKAPGNHLGGLH